MKTHNVTPLVEQFPRSEDQRGILTEIRQEKNVFTLYSGDKDGTFALATSKDATDLKEYAFEMGAQSVRMSFDLRVLRNA